MLEDLASRCRLQAPDISVDRIERCIVVHQLMESRSTHYIGHIPVDMYAATEDGVAEGRAGRETLKLQS